MTTVYDYEAPGGGPPAKRPLVLVVDDDAGARRAILRALHREGLDVAEATGGEDALAQFDAQPPELVLCDVQMPDRSGFDVCEEMRRRPGGTEIPIVMMTGLDDDDSIRRAYDVGATDFLTKPIQAPLLQHRLRYLLRASANVQALRRSEARLGTAQRLARMGSWHLDLDSGEFVITGAFADIIGSDDGNPASIQDLADAIVEEDREMLLDAVKKCMKTGESVAFDHRVRRTDGATRVLQCQIHMAFDDEGEPAMLEGTSQDVTERRQTEEQVQYLAFHDDLTGLGNRKLFEQRLFLAVHDARRQGARVGVLMVALNHFRRINESLGHSTGDLLLRTTAERLSAAVRDLGAVGVATGSASLARLGGNEFTVLLPNVGDPEVLDAIARAITESLGEPLHAQGHEVTLGISIGVAVFPNDGPDVATLLRNADAALSHAKHEGRASHQFYDESMNAVALKRLILESKLRRALENNEFELYYQPKLELETQKITGFEGLLRWKDPELGTVMPGDFIPIAEETGLIHPLGDWVLRAACRQAVAWRGAGVCDVPIAVNVSTMQFQREGLASHIAQIIAEESARPSDIGIEITESAVLHDPGGSVSQLEELRDLGIEIALDDFGTGYSSLSHLRNLPVDVVKIDRSFVKEVGTRDDDAALTASIVQMGLALGLRIVAEGVEERVQRDLLRSWGCHEMQGYLFSPPVPAAEAEQLWLEIERS